MEQEFIRDYVMYAAIFGILSFVWFGWAQENPRQSWRKYLGIGSAIALIVSAVGVYFSVTNWSESSALSEMDAFTMYLIVFYTQLIIGAIVAFILIRKKLGDYVAPWIGLLVGIHFIFLVDVFEDPSLYLLAAIMIIIAVISPWLAKKFEVGNSTITGIGNGVILLCFAILGLVRYLLM